MSLEQFHAEPWKHSHPAYDGSAINIRPAPEFATAEVVVASLYRWVGFQEQSEATVPASGREFDRLMTRARTPSYVEPLVTPDTWRTVVRGVLESPKQPNQSSKRFLQMTPVVPDVALYSGSARLTGNSWNPGQLVHRMVLLGAADSQTATRLWSELFDSLSVNQDDDIWARWLQSEFERWGSKGPKWTRRSLEHDAVLPPMDRAEAHFPAQQFVRDLESVLAVKDAMTRRQWISVLEALLRIGTVAHTLWLCDVNDGLWQAAQRAMNDGDSIDPSTVRKSILTSRQSYLAYGTPAVSGMRDYAAKYLIARLGLNLLLHQLTQIGEDVASLSSSDAISDFLAAVARNRATLQQGGFAGGLDALQYNSPRTMACKKGIGANLVEFCRYTLGQRQTANDALRGYDQGYFLRKEGAHRSAQWVVSFGPVAILALVHCCLREASGPRSVSRLCQHLAAYGLEVDRDDIAASDLGRKLRMLGLVLDSPDAEGGMLLLPPFQRHGLAGGPEA